MPRRRTQSLRPLEHQAPQAQCGGPLSQILVFVVFVLTFYGIKHYEPLRGSAWGVDGWKRWRQLEQMTLQSYTRSGQWPSSPRPKPARSQRLGDIRCGRISVGVLLKHCAFTVGSTWQKIGAILRRW